MKKHYVIATLLLILTKSLSADCMSSGIWAYPETNKIDVNGFIILETYGTSQGLIPELGHDVQIHLRAHDHCINLAKVEVIKGAHNISQVIFKVEQELEVGTNYYLEYKDSIQIAKRVRGNWKDAVWVAARLIKTENESLKIEHHKNSFMLYGCGPSMFADFKTSIMDSALMIRAELNELNAPETTTYIIPIDTLGTVSIGHGMCSGGFTFKGSKKYRARFKIYDFISPKYEYGDWIEFDSPVDYEYNHFIKLID
ncbi:MAG: hypothetical protein JXQ87_08160 [Bacteroidia bacterium]